MLSFVAGVVGWVVSQLGGAFSFLPHGVQIGLQAVTGLLTVLGIRSASSDPSAVLKGWLDKLPSGIKTALGALVWVTGVLLSPDVYGTLSPHVAGVVEVVGQVLMALGLYHAAAKQAVAAR